MTKKYTYIEKSNGQTLSATEWNNLAQDVSAAVDAINNGAVSGGSSAIDTAGVVSVNSKGNTTISSSKHVNIEPVYDQTGSENGTYGDVQIKPGDDITLESHHRPESKKDEITVKTSNGLSGNEKAPVKLQVIASDITLSTKGKLVELDSNDSPNVMNVNVTTGDGKGYLKVRAQAIDLRCEEHGGIALQPKGEDGHGHQNKIKFEHGGGDGLEFGTFNTEKTSIFTDEYRFNREGVWKMATRQKEVSDKANESDATTAYKYVKQSDDFYDIISNDDAQCTTKDIIKTASALNGAPGVHTKTTSDGELEIATEVRYELISASPANGDTNAANFVIGEFFTSEEIFDNLFSDIEIIRNLGNMSTGDTLEVSADSGTVATFKKHAPNIKLDSCAKLKLKGILDFGDTFNFGETENGIEVQYKLTRKNATKDCGVLKVVGVNNHATNTLTVEGVTINPGETQVIAQCSILDIIKLVNYMKSHNDGPWTQSQS